MMIVEKVVCHFSLVLQVLTIEIIETSLLLCTLFDFFFMDIMVFHRSGSEDKKSLYI